MLSILLSLAAQAGGGPANVMVLYNADSVEAGVTAEHYAQARDIAADHLCGVSGIEAGTLSIAVADYETQILQPLEACIAALAHPEDIDYVVIVRDLPYKVDLPDGGYATSLGAMIQVGRAARTSDGVPLMGQPQAREPERGFRYATVANPLFQWGSYSRYNDDHTASYGYSPYYVTSSYFVRGEATPPTFRRTDGERVDAGVDWTDHLLMVTRLDGFDHDDARALVDRALLSEQAVADAPFVCMRARDGARGVRDAECEHTLRMLDAAGFATEWIPAFDGALEGREVMAYWTGSADLKGAIDGQTYAPGAIAHNLTSYGAVPKNFVCSEDGETCPTSESQTSIARFVRAGATGAHGTVAEPLNNVFPNAGTMVLYAHGYNMGESWMYNQRFLYWVNLYIGDPLTTPYATRPTVQAPESTAINLPIALTATHSNGIANYRVYADGVVVHDGPEDAFSLEGVVEPGQEVELLVVAIAADVPVDYTDVWPTTEPVAFQPAVQGWIRSTYTAGEPWVEPEPEPEGCSGCHSTSTGAAWLGLPLLMAFMGRRRRSTWTS